MDPLGIVSRRYSAALFSRILLFILAGGLLSAFFIYLTAHRSMGEGYETALTSIQDLKEILLIRTILVNSVIGLFILAAVGLLNLFYSHRVAGPLFRIGREAGRIRSGDLTVKVTLRKKDVVVPLAEELTRMADDYRDRVIALRGRCEELASMAASTKRLIDGRSEAVRVEAAIEDLKRKHQEIEKGLSEIRL